MRSCGGLDGSVVEIVPPTVTLIGAAPVRGRRVGARSPLTATLIGPFCTSTVWSRRREADGLALSAGPAAPALAALLESA